MIARLIEWSMRHRFLVGCATGLGRVVGVVGSEAGGFVVLLFVSINILDIPER